MDKPATVLAISFSVLFAAAQFGAFMQRRSPKAAEADHDDLGTILTATLTLLGLIIGFTFSMAVTRYDLRKKCESEEANAIGTEYLRLGVLPKNESLKAKSLLRDYLKQRVVFYSMLGSGELERNNQATARIQDEMWSVIEAWGAGQPTSMSMLAAAGMNDVLNSQGYTQAAWWNRIPVEAWGLMGIVAIFGNVLLGYDARRPQPGNPAFLILPLILSISFLLIADMDSPRGGIIRIHPQNLEGLSISLATSGDPQISSPEH
jgi:hypothetical protein